jgi:hypothetical protein
MQVFSDSEISISELKTDGIFLRRLGVWAGMVLIPFDQGKGAFWGDRQHKSNDVNGREPKKE